MTNKGWRGLAAACLVAIAAGAAWTGAQGAVVQTAGEADRDAIRAHIDRIFKAYIAKNRPEVEATHDREWRGFLTGSPTIIKGINEYMRSADGTLKSTQTGMQRYRMEQFDVQFRGDMAVVPYVAEVTGQSEGLQRTYKLRVLDVYERQHGEWMQVASNTAMHPQSVFEQMSEQQPLVPSQRTELLKEREAVWRAWFGGDDAALKKVLPDEFIALGGGPEGFSSREATIKSSLEFAKGGGRLTKLEFPRTEIQAYGATAILYTTYAYEIENGGKRSGEKGSAIELFVRRPHGWVHTGWQLRPDPPAKTSE